jgi:hypothetical protein
MGGSEKDEHHHLHGILQWYFFFKLRMQTSFILWGNYFLSNLSFLSLYQTCFLICLSCLIQEINKVLIDLNVKHIVQIITNNGSNYKTYRIHECDQVFLLLFAMSPIHGLSIKLIIWVTYGCHTIWYLPKHPTSILIAWSILDYDMHDMFDTSSMTTL